MRTRPLFTFYGTLLIKFLIVALSSDMSFYLPRVTHHDCVHLDAEFEKHFVSKLLSLLNNLHNSASNWLPEIELVVKLFVWRQTALTTCQTIGQRLLSCHYSRTDGRTASRKLIMLFAFSNAISTWLHRRFEDPDFLTLNRTQRKFLSSCSKILQTVNAFVYVYEGKFASLNERLFGLSMVSSVKRTWNTIPSAILTRELLWDAINEFLTFFWPIVRRTRWMTRLRNIANAPDSVGDETCLLCRETPKTQPHRFCEHSFCYFCVADAFERSNQFFICPVCGSELKRMEDFKPVTPSIWHSDCCCLQRTRDNAWKTSIQSLEKNMLSRRPLNLLLRHWARTGKRRSVVSTQAGIVRHCSKCSSEHINIPIERIRNFRWDGKSCRNCSKIMNTHRAH